MSPHDAPGSETAASDATLMRLAVEAAERVRVSAPPNPWVGAAIRLPDGSVITGATEPIGQRHAERVALDELAQRRPEVDPADCEMAVTLEPCAHHGRTGPCADALVAAGIGRLAVGVVDPDPKVAEKGIARLRSSGADVVVDVERDVVEKQLAPYLHQRRTGRPYVVLKVAATLDGGTAAPDGSSQWITGAEARADAHRLRAESDVVIVGAGTVRADDPSLTVRDWQPRHLPDGVDLDPDRIVLGRAPIEARVRPCREYSGELADLLDELGCDGVCQVMIEGGSGVAGAAHRAGLVDLYRIYVAPALFGGQDALPIFAGPGAATMANAWRGEIVDVRRLGVDLAVDLVPSGKSSARPSE